MSQPGRKDLSDKITESVQPRKSCRDHTNLIVDDFRYRVDQVYRQWGMLQLELIQWLIFGSSSCRRINDRHIGQRRRQGPA